MNVIEVGLSFFEGLALIASPCILPVLPLMLSASIDGGRKRPFGIIVGFVLAFTLFALFARKLVMLLGIDLDYIKYASLVLLTGFAVILFSQKLSQKFSNLTQRFAGVGGSLASNNKDGFVSGIIIGMLIGLIWTPCAGPILAAVLVQIIRQETDSQALIMILSFAIGAAVPMFIIAITGRKIMSKLGFFTAHAEAVRKVFAVIILIAVACIATGVNANNLFSKSNAATVQSNSLQDGLETPYPAPEFAGIEAWLNANPLTMQSLKGKVVLIDFWTYSCINCVRTLPYITKWDEKYRDQGLVIIGVHAPEFEFEKNKDNVAAAIAAHNIKYPVALDNRLDTWQNFKNRYWPAHYLIDKDGKVVYTHFGEGKYSVTENNIRYLLGLNTRTEGEPEIRRTNYAQTHETYLGYARSQNFADPASIKKDAIALYKQAKFLPSDHWGLGGKWQIEKERIVSDEADATLQINFTAKKVFLVLGTKDNQPINIDLSLNGEKLKSINVDRHNLYELVNQDAAKNALLEIKTSKPGLEAYAFTFGN